MKAKVEVIKRFKQCFKVELEGGRRPPAKRLDYVVKSAVFCYMLSCTLTEAIPEVMGLYFACKQDIFLNAVTTMKHKKTPDETENSGTFIG